MMNNYETLAEYPTSMQRLIAMKALYESYDAKRILTREGHRAFSFYFILSGSGWCLRVGLVEDNMTTYLPF